MAPAEPTPRRRDEPSTGGWTGTLVVLWSAGILVVATLVAAAVTHAVAVGEVMLAGMESEAVKQRLPPDTIAGPGGAVLDASRAVMIPTRGWALVFVAIALPALVAGLRLVSGGRWARRAVRLLLALFVLAAIAAGLHLSAALLSGWDERVALVSAAFAELAAVSADAPTPEDVESALSGTHAAIAMWCGPALVVAPTFLLWLACGRRALRDWCAARSERATRA